jgi:transposase
MWYSGIDQHKAFCLITTYGPEGPRVKQARVACTPLALQQYFAEFPGPHQAVVESTGGWYWLADALGALSVELVLAHATRVKAIAAAKVKTDKVDSDILALLFRADLIPRAHMISAGGVRPARPHAHPAPARRKSRQRPEQHRPAAGEVQRRRRTGTRRALSVPGPLPRRPDPQIRTLERALYPFLIPHADVQRLLWIPGLGKVNAFTIQTEIDGITRFRSEGQFFSYCRLVPGADNSAGKTRHRSGCKAGTRYLKLAFSHAGIRAVQYYPEIRTFFKAKARKKPIRIARTLVALERARLVYQVLTKQEDFNGQFKGRTLSRRKHAPWPRRASPAA